MAEGPRYCSWAPERLLRDPRVRRMGGELFGGYCSLLIEAWLDPDGTLPNDAGELALLSRLGRSWGKHEKEILALFTVDGDRLRTEIVDEAREQVRRRSAQAKEAVAARIEKNRKVEPGDVSGDERPMNDRSSKEKEKVKEKVKVKENSGGKPPEPPKGSGYSSEFETFWALWKGLGSTNPVNKKGAFDSWGKALKRGVTPNDIISGVKEYGIYLDEKVKTKADARDFIPMPETWLNQGRFMAEYPGAETRSKSGVPTNGVDFYFGADGDSFRKFAIVDGQKTETPFDEEAWKAGGRR